MHIGDSNVQDHPQGVITLTCYLGKQVEERMSKFLVCTMDTKQCNCTCTIYIYIFQVYNRLNHVGVCVSYTTTLKLVGEVSQIHEVPLQQWIQDDVIFKFWGDNVDKKRGVQDVRSDNQGTMLHMYSLLVGRSHIPGNGLSRTGQVAKLSSLPSECVGLLNLT